MTNSPTATLPDANLAAPNARLVLVVEDNERNARLLEAMLKCGGYVSRWACDGTQGLQMAKELRPMMVITDLQMPGMDGLEMTRHLKEDPQTASIPVIALTAHAMAGNREKYLSAGFNDYITKPIVDETILIEAIERWLQRR